MCADGASSFDIHLIVSCPGVFQRGYEHGRLCRSPAWELSAWIWKVQCSMLSNGVYALQRRISRRERVMETGSLPSSKLAVRHFATVRAIAGAVCTSYLPHKLTPPAGRLKRRTLFALRKLKSQSCQQAIARSLQRRLNRSVPAYVDTGRDKFDASHCHQWSVAS